ncbi:hypothetical protein JTB14_023874 [Gonioctena quinquepunctata]|nr:hypothetical protein JTB14_023874 [Gonioctena quinquepunctata]
MTLSVLEEEPRKTSYKNLFKPPKLREDLDNNIWENGYKIANGRFVKTNLVGHRLNMAKNIAQVLFPQAVDENPIIPYDLEVKIFTEDGIPPEAIKIASLEAVMEPSKAVETDGH